MKPEKLLNYAVEAQTRSQSKYSNFPVGCAILTKCDNVILGCNIESAAYPSTMCAERVAIYSALSQGFIEFKAIAIVSKIGAKPCGPCRQIIHEYLGNEKDEYREIYFEKNKIIIPLDNMSLNRRDNSIRGDREITFEMKIQIGVKIEYMLRNLKQQ